MNKQKRPGLKAYRSQKMTFWKFWIMQKSISKSLRIENFTLNIKLKSISKSNQYKSDQTFQ